MTEYTHHQRNRSVAPPPTSEAAPPSWLTPNKQLLWHMRRGRTIVDGLGGPVTYSPRTPRDRSPWLSQSGALRYTGAQCRVRGLT